MSPQWQPYTTSNTPHTVTGDLRVWHDFYSPQQDNQRDVYLWLPPDYATSDRHYPVIYMHDGQNLFDAQIAYSGEWGVDEALTALHPAGYAAIVVGLHNMNEGRRGEYDPYPPGTGADYIRFLVETVKPQIDADFRTLPDAPNTIIAGSSMGGLISLYGFLTHPDVFGGCGAFSTAYWFGDEGLVNRTIPQHASGQGRIYLDVGGKEGIVVANFGVGGDDPDMTYVNGVRALRDALLAQGYVDGDTLLYVEEADGEHNEPAWARRLPDALRYLLK